MFRLAPTPSGFIHLGNLFHFWLTRDWAQRLGKPLLLRIDDLDEERCQPYYVDFLFESLAFFDIRWNSGPKNAFDLAQHWSQKHRLELYGQYVQVLKKRKHVFYCSCSRKQIHEAGQISGCVAHCRAEQSLKDPLRSALRLQTENREMVLLNWEGHRESLPADASVREFVVQRREGVPAYQLASLADDLHFGVTHIIRGVDLMPSTWAQLQLAEMLQATAFQHIRFLHHPLLMEGDQKLSKSNQSPAIQLTSDSRKEYEEAYQAWIHTYQLLPY